MLIKYKLVYHPCNLTAQLNIHVRWATTQKQVVWTTKHGKYDGTVLVLRWQSSTCSNMSSLHIYSLVSSSLSQISAHLPTTIIILFSFHTTIKDGCKLFYGFPLALRTTTTTTTTTINNTLLFRAVLLQEIVINDATILRHRCSSNKTPTTTIIIPTRKNHNNKKVHIIYYSLFLLFIINYLVAPTILFFHQVLLLLAFFFFFVFFILKKKSIIIKCLQQCSMMMLLHSHHCCSNSATYTRAIVMITYLEVDYGAFVLLVI